MCLKNVYYKLKLGYASFEPTKTHLKNVEQDLPRLFGPPFCFGKMYRNSRKLHEGKAYSNACSVEIFSHVQDCTA